MILCFSRGHFLKLSQLKPDTRNANKGTARGRKVVRESLERYGAGRSILVDKSGNIIAGNKTAEGARAAGILDVQVVKSDGTKLIAVQRTDLDINDKAARELAIADNRAAELGLEWDLDVLNELKHESVDLSPFWDERELVQFFANPSGEAPEPKIELAAELKVKWGTELGQLWLIGAHRLLCGDSTSEAAVARLWANVGQQPGLMVTDPPYGVEYDPNWRNERTLADGRPIGGRAIGVVHNDDRNDWTKAWELSPAAVAYVWHAGAHASRVQASLEAAGFEVRNQIIWNKAHFVFSRGHYHWKHEPCWYAVRKGKSAGWIGDHSQTTVWDVEHSKNDTGHSTQKPIECMARPMRNHEGGAVYDPFLGSGTTMVAAEQLNRICHGVEIDPGYVAVALERMADMGLTPKLADA